jgi:hypothetical protein
VSGHFASESKDGQSLLNAEAKAVAFGIHAAVAALFLDGERG